AQFEAVLERRGDVAFRAAHRLLEAQPARQICRERRRERASRPVRAAARYSPALELDEAAAVVKQIRRVRVVLAMSALDDDRPRAELDNLDRVRIDSGAAIRTRASTSASGILGVTMRAMGISRFRIARSPLGPISSAPLLDTITGSTTGAGNLRRSIARATAFTIAALASAPVLTARGANSSASVSSCASTISGDTGSTSATTRLFCAITCVMTE